jgi:hypothetical protein
MIAKGELLDASRWSSAEQDRLWQAQPAGDKAAGVIVLKPGNMGSLRMAAKSSRWTSEAACGGVDSALAV